MIGIIAQRPGAARQGRDQLTESQIGTLNKGGLYQARQFEFFQGSAYGFASTEANNAVKEAHLVAITLLVQLGILESRIGEPVELAGAGRLVPEAGMGCQAVEVLVETIRGENRETAWR